MALFTGPVWSTLVISNLLLLVSLPHTATALVQSWCSTQNTGAGFSGFSDDFQSNGLCHDFCKFSYSVAIVQGPMCWCANEVPANSEDISRCSVNCFGYPSEKCGNLNAGYFGYVKIEGKNPTTLSASSVTATSRSVSTPQSSSGFSSSRPTTSLPSGTSSLTTSTSQSSVSLSVEPSTTVITITGLTRTIVVTPTVTVSTSPNNSAGASTGSSNSSGGNSLNTGSVVGIVLGVALGLGLLIGVGVWFWFRRKHQRALEEGSFHSPSGSARRTGFPSRQVSQMSSAGLIGSAPRIITSGMSPSNGPRSADAASHDRRSLGTDQRLNPHLIYSQDESRHSNVSLQDNHDYSRQLRVANPDT